MILVFDLLQRKSPEKPNTPKLDITGVKSNMSNSNRTFNRIAATLVATLVGSSLSTGAVYAASDDDEMIEEIVVTGIRGSLQQSLERKRDADHFVDAITAEDIGSFPDQNYKLFMYILSHRVNDWCVRFFSCECVRKRH